MFIICENEEWEKGVRRKRRLKHRADFIAIYHSEDREWAILKDVWTNSGEVATEQEFENIVSEAMSKWAARSIQRAARNNTSQGLPQQPHIDPSKVSQKLQQTGSPIPGLNMTSSESDSSDGEDEDEPEPRPAEPTVKTDKLDALTSDDGSGWFPF